MSAPVYDVAMLGPSGVGKTSLLSAIHSEFMTRIPGTELHVRSVPGSSSWLQDRRSELERICRSAYVEEPGILGTSTAKSIELALGRVDSTQDADGHLTMRFTDHPGAWMFSDELESEKSQLELQDRFDKSDVLIVVVDTPSLMVERGKFNHEVNRAQQAAERLNTWLSKKDRRLVIFAPVKCEAWIDRQDPEPGLTQIKAGFDEGYKEALTFLKRTQTPSVLVPVRTVGGLVHDGFRIGPSGTLKSRYRGASGLPKYDPAWGGEILRRVVVESINRRVDERGFLEELSTWFGHHRDIHMAVKLMKEQTYGPSRVLTDGSADE